MLDLRAGGNSLRLKTLTKMSVVLETQLALPLVHRGKVRDNYSLNDRLLIVATDRISAFDSVLPCGIPQKGTVLNLLSAFWFQKTAHLVPNHLLEVLTDARQIAAYVSGQRVQSLLVNRAMMVKKAERIPVECVVRGYLSGSAWAEYSKSGTIHGMPAARGLQESQKLPQPVFTPTTKADTGHDLPMSMAELADSVGEETAGELQDKSLLIYGFAEEYARSRGILIADTKMEFGFIDGGIALIDELLTPDSSRFWDSADYQPGRPQASFDKQMVRDWLVASGWNKEPPAPMLPEDLIRRTSERYIEAYLRLTGTSLSP